MSTKSFSSRSRGLVMLAAMLALVLPVIAQAASFAPPVSYATGGIRPNSIAVGDLNGNGVNDLVVANSSSNTVGVLLGNGSGGFSAPTTYPVGGGPLSVAIGDINGDSIPDVATANWRTDNVSVLLGSVGGALSAAAHYGVGDQPEAVAIGDVNGDGLNDLVAANRLSDSLTVLYADNAGLLSHASDFPAGDGPISVALGDLDGDGDLDAGVALFEGDSVSVLLGNGTGFAAPATYASGNGPQGVALGYLNGDLRQDIAVATYFQDFAATFLNDGLGVFSGQPGIGAGDGPKSIAIGDLDGDGHNDLAIAAADSDSLSVLPGDGAGGFGAYQTFPAGDQPASIGIAQLDGSGLADVVVANRFGETVSVYVNTSSPPPVAPDTTAPVITVPADFAVEATSAAGAQVSYTASAEDNRDLAPSLSCDPAPGSTFPLGATTVHCAAMDASGNSSEADFIVTVTDSGKPTLNLPANKVVNATSPAGAVVAYSVTASDAIDPDVAISCRPASGATFAIGTATVNCTATDDSGNATAGSFTVRVKGAPEQIADLIDKVRAIKGLAPVLATVRSYLETIAQCVIQNNKPKACTYAGYAISAINLAVSKRYISAAVGNDLKADVNRIKAVIGCP